MKHLKKKGIKPRPELWMLPIQRRNDSAHNKMATFERKKEEILP